MLNTLNTRENEITKNKISKYVNKLDKAINEKNYSDIIKYYTHFKFHLTQEGGNDLKYDTMELNNLMNEKFNLTIPFDEIPLEQLVNIKFDKIQKIGGVPNNISDINRQIELDNSVKFLDNKNAIMLAFDEVIGDGTIYEGNYQKTSVEETKDI